jgi:hypothetical protein
MDVAKHYAAFKFKCCWILPMFEMSLNNQRHNVTSRKTLIFEDAEVSHGNDFCDQAKSVSDSVSQSVSPAVRLP